MASCSTTPRREPMWTVPEGVFESLTTCGPSNCAASSSAQNMRCGSPAPLVRAVLPVSGLSRRSPEASAEAPETRSG